MTVLTLLVAGQAAASAQMPTAIPKPTADPLSIDMAADPILSLTRDPGRKAPFQALIAQAVRLHPAVAEVVASEDEARAARAEARARRYPSIDASLSAYETLARDFSDDPQNIIERSRARRRVDLLVNAQQTLVDFGATRHRIDAASARLAAAAAAADDRRTEIALRAVAAYYDVFGYRVMVSLAEQFAGSQRDLGRSIAERIDSGVAAASDAARVDGYVASAERRTAEYRRLQASAEARFTELFGRPPPPGLARAPAPDVAPLDREAAQVAARDVPVVRSAADLARSARAEARAARSDTLPNLSAGIDAGRYGVIENQRDYDIRARVTLRQRLFGGIDSRADQARARAAAAEARAATARIDAEREAAVAWADVSALEDQRVALEQAYVAGRRSRDVLTERFRAARGTLFDLLAAEDAYFANATAYIQAVTELDAARYVLLARTGGLLGALDLPTSGVTDRR